MRVPILPLAAIALTLAACSVEPAPDPAAPIVTTPTRPAKPPPPSRTMRPAVELGALQGDAGREHLQGELGCSWLDAEGTRRLAAAANVGSDQRGTAVAVFDGRTVPLAARDAGGFGALEHGTTFEGEGFVVTVGRGARIATGTEEGRFEARLAVKRDGAPVWSEDGTWTCGP